MLFQLFLLVGDMIYGSRATYVAPADWANLQRSKSLSVAIGAVGKSLGVIGEYCPPVMP